MILDSLFVINAGAAVALLPRRAKGRQSVRRGPESIRHAHQTRTEHSPEDAYRQNLRRFVTKTKSRHGKRMDTRRAEWNTAIKPHEAHFTITFDKEQK